MGSANIQLMAYDVSVTQDQQTVCSQLRKLVSGRHASVQRRDAKSLMERSANGERMARFFTVRLAETEIQKLSMDQEANCMPGCTTLVQADCPPVSLQSVIETAVRPC